MKNHRYVFYIVYQRAHDTLWELVEQKELIQDTQEAYYVYELTMNGRVQTGLVACADVDDYLNGVIPRSMKIPEKRKNLTAFVM